MRRRRVRREEKKSTKRAVAVHDVAYSARRGQVGFRCPESRILGVSFVPVCACLCFGDCLLCSAERKKEAKAYTR